MEIFVSLSVCGCMTQRMQCCSEPRPGVASVRTVDRGKAGGGLSHDTTKQAKKLWFGSEVLSMTVRWPVAVVPSSTRGH